MKRNHGWDVKILACAPDNTAADGIALRLTNNKRVDERDILRLNGFCRYYESVPEKVDMVMHMSCSSRLCNTIQHAFMSFDSTCRFENCVTS